MQIIPTVLEKGFEAAEKRLNLIRKKSGWIQVDVVDGIFVAGKSFELELINSWEFSEKVLWDIHLMVKEPIKWIEKCIFVGASRVSGQVEMMSDRKGFVRKLKDEGLEAGVAFDIETKIDRIPPETDWVLLMGRKAGFGKYDLDRRVFEKIKRAKEEGCRVAVDGGVIPDNIGKLEAAGVEIVYSGENFEKIDAGKNE